MAKDQNGSSSAHDGGGDEEETVGAARSGSKSLDAEGGDRSKGSRDRGHRGKSKRREEDEGSESSGEDYSERRKRRRKEKERRRRRRSRSESSGSSSESESESSYSGSSAESDSESESEEERRRRRRKRRKEREEEDRRRRRKEKERRKRKEKEKERERRKKKRRKEEEKDLGKKGAVTNSWGKYGIIREVDMWNKRPEFTAWLSEIKQVNLESLSNWEEKQMFKEFMEDHNTATFPSKKYYDLDAYHRKAMEKEKRKGLKTLVTERTVFNDEEQRRLELLKERERRKEEEVEALKRSMQAGLAQDMKDQVRLREEMLYQYKLGNFQAAAAIQKRLDPDAPPP
ncbi:uncharacterized protein LOC133887996 [Phragmites australis]|uniref:uncharacterized protein LOC133887996 n=1 Tax=Phragmites australis TaxID=29695 RepID=UPI002D77AC53|nr:uncharacterized protein LOC133887996 [Phragmites australis]